MIDILISIIGTAIVFSIPVLIFLALPIHSNHESKNNDWLEAGFYIFCLLIAVFYLVSYWLGINIFPNLYSRFYQNECSITEFEPFYDDEGIEHYASLKSGGLSLSYWSDGQMISSPIDTTKTHIYLSPDGRAYYEKNRMVIKNPWFRFITMSSYNVSTNIYLPELDYREFQSEMCN